MCMEVNVRMEDKPIRGWNRENKDDTLRAILSYPTREALAGAVDGVACAVVGTEADLTAGPPVPAAWTDCKKRRIIKHNFAKQFWTEYYYQHAKTSRIH